MAKVDSTASFYVYVHRRATDGRVFYVGKGKGKGRRAWNAQGRSNYWRNIVAKHGLIVEIVQDNLQEWWAFEMECELIAFYGRENLCNLTDGGEGASGALRSEETIAKNIALHTGKKRSAESCKRMSDAQKSSLNKSDISGDKNPAKREEVKIKMRVPKPSIRGEKNAMHRPDVKAKFMAIVQSASYKSKMSESIKASRLDLEVVQRHKEAIRRSYEDQLRREKAVQNMARIRQSPEIQATRRKSITAFYETHGVKIMCVETGNIFRFQREAVDWLRCNGFPQATAIRISDVIHGKRKSAYGFTWRHA